MIVLTLYIVYQFIKSFLGKKCLFLRNMEPLMISLMFNYILWFNYNRLRKSNYFNEWIDKTDWFFILIDNENMHGEKYNFDFAEKRGLD